MEISELLLKAASLCDAAAARLSEPETPEKVASKAVDALISKGMITESEAPRYKTILEKQASSGVGSTGFTSFVDALPMRQQFDAGEVASSATKTASYEDAGKLADDKFDSFLYT
jgi:hypothetical protein